MKKVIFIFLMVIGSVIIPGVIERIPDTIYYTPTRGNGGSGTGGGIFLGGFPIGFGGGSFGGGGASGRF